MTQISIDKIHRNENQPRQSFTGIDELAASIEAQGLLEPLVVRPIGGAFELVAGERRLRACRQAGLQQVDCIVRELSDAEAFQLSVMENMQRENLTPMEEAKAFQQLQAQGMKQGEIGKLVGLSQSQVATKVRILSLPDDVLQAWDTGHLSDGHVKQLLRLETPEEQSQFAADVMSRDIKVKHLKGAVDARLKHLEAKREIEKRSQTEPEYIPSDDELLVANGVVNPWSDVWYAENFANAPTRLHGVFCALVCLLEDALSRDSHDSIKKVAIAGFDNWHKVDLEMAVQSMRRQLTSMAEAHLIFLDFDEEKKEYAFEVIRKAKPNQVVVTRCGPDKPSLDSKYDLGLPSLFRNMSKLNKNLYHGHHVVSIIRDADEDGNFCTPDEIEELRQQDDSGFGLIHVVECLEPFFMSCDMAKKWQACFVTFEPELA
ncbi:MAG: ParB/RepB/Spo0J family partition protein [Desulfovermiculus sp.]|nr:ParB/RepB/Spo0J family partition protein [Desulfovermiculus sp.]